MPLSVAGLIDHDFRADFELPLYFLTEEGGKLAGERLKNGKANPESLAEVEEAGQSIQDTSVIRTLWKVRRPRWNMRSHYNRTGSSICRVINPRGGAGKLVMNDGKEHLDTLKVAADPGGVAVALGLRGEGPPLLLSVL